MAFCVFPLIAVIMVTAIYRTPPVTQEMYGALGVIQVIAILLLGMVIGATLMPHVHYVP